MASSALPRQFALDINQAPKPSLHNFLPNGNEALVDALSQSIARWNSPSKTTSHSIEGRWFYWWGTDGAGCSHLLSAMANQAEQHQVGSIRLSPNEPSSWVDAEHKLSAAVSSAPIIMTLDDVDRLDPHQQASLFRLLNVVHASPYSFVYLSGHAPPAQLALREDLRTRIGWGLIFEVHPLSDSEKIEALSRAAKERGLVLSNDVLPWLIHHFYRDMPSLMALLDALDAYSLETKRAITLPLVRELLQISGHTP
ncbi:DnaA regulatory inactivator Hda [Polynucleobacter acidiphobus]|uniref:DnaA regulatory inactivator Hda n=1 Tax=Polynucleobacter acidiphobus TaxID=556053 RepID=UPI000D39D6BB|nr:DnaA regulatory inactivator Hda [Polynucleobacter acidiphobus]